MHWHGPRFNEFASRVFAIGVMAVSIPALSEAASITFSVVGSGGTSAPVAGFSDSPFWWIDSTGNVAGSALATYGFNPVVALPGPRRGEVQVHPREAKRQVRLHV